MNCIIVENDASVLKDFESKIKELPNIKLLASFDSALKANDFLRNNDVDVMFLETNLPGLSGLDFARSLKNPPLIVFISDSKEYAFEAFDLEAVDYLMRPITMERLFKSVNKIEAFLRNCKETIAVSCKEDFIFVKSERKYIRLAYNEIIFIEGLKDYVILHTIDGARYMTAMNVKTIFNKLPSDIFFRTSKSYVINVNHISEIDGDDVIVAENSIPIGRSYRDKFLSSFVNKRLVRRK